MLTRYALIGFALTATGCGASHVAARGAVEVATGMDETCVRTASGQVWCVGRWHPGRAERMPVPPSLDLSSDLDGCSRSAGALHCWFVSATEGTNVDRIAEASDPLHVVAASGGGAFFDGPGGEARIFSTDACTSPGCLTVGVPLPDHTVTHHTTWRIRTRDLPGEIQDVGLGPDGICAILGDGSTWCVPMTSPAAPPVAVPLAEESERLMRRAAFPPLRALDGGPNHGCLHLATDAVRCWELGPSGLNWYDVALDDVVSLAASSRTVLGTPGGSHACAIRGDGEVWCWGMNGCDVQPVPDATYDPVPNDCDFAVDDAPVLVPLPDAATQIDVGGFHACATLRSAEVYCWGSNYFGQLGDGTRRDSTRPVVAGIVTSDG